MCRKYPQFQQGDLFALTDAFHKLDVDDKGYIDEATAIKATQTTERQPYDVVRQALREVELDSSRRVELEDYVDVSRARLLLTVIYTLGNRKTEKWISNPSFSPSLVDRQITPILHSPEAHVHRWPSWIS